MKVIIACLSEQFRSVTSRATAANLDHQYFERSAYTSAQSKRVQIMTHMANRFGNNWRVNDHDFVCVCAGVLGLFRIIVIDVNQTAVTVTTAAVTTRLRLTFSYLIS